MPGMAIALSIVGVTFAASCVWLTVRIVNRREWWARCTLAAVVALPALYVLSVGPAFWITGHCFRGSKQAHRFFNRTYRPVASLAHLTEPTTDFFIWYLNLWGNRVN